MKLYEYEAKRIFAQYGIPIPEGDVATTPTQAREIAAKLNVPVAIKAQILVAGRGKAGGILFANTPEEAELAAKKLLSTKIKGVPVPSVSSLQARRRVVPQSPIRDRCSSAPSGASAWHHSLVPL